MCTQPEPIPISYGNLIKDVENGRILIPKFQRDFVWSIEKTAELLDSILKGYPIGTFILWRTTERLNDIKAIGNLEIQPVEEGREVRYVLDGQQRITSLFAAYCGARIKKPGEKKETDYKQIYVDLDQDINDTSEQIVIVEKRSDRCIPLTEILNINEYLGRIIDEHGNEMIVKANACSQAFRTYNFSTVILTRDDIDSAIEVFTRINTGGQKLSLFEIMSAKTYDEELGFDMQKRWDDFSKKLKSKNYEGVSSSIILYLISLMVSKTKECKRKVILSLPKEDIIDSWYPAIEVLEEAIDYFKTVYRIPVSQILPYDSLLVPFAYFFHVNKGDPDSEQRGFLEELFWRVSLSFRYSNATEGKLAQDIKRIERIIAKERPEYNDVKVQLNSSKDLIEANFSAGNSFCKAVICLFAYNEPKDFRDSRRVTLDNSSLKRANSKNYHHFFPKDYLKDRNISNANSLMNITLVRERLNKGKIRKRAPSDYIGEFAEENEDIERALSSHFISLTNHGISNDDYPRFLAARAETVFKEITSRLELRKKESVSHSVEEIILRGESEKVEFKATLRYDKRQRGANKKLEFVVAKTVAAFMNASGGELFIGVEDDTLTSLGLDDDLSTLSQRNIDAYERKLVEVIGNYLGREKLANVSISFPEYDGQKICQVSVERSSRPVFVKHQGQDEFYVRMGCSSQPLSRSEQSVYEKEHWDNL